MGKLIAATAFCGLVLASLSLIYQTKNATKTLYSEVISLRDASHELEIEIETMRLEKEHLERPENLLSLAEALGLEPIKPGQMTTPAYTKSLFMQ